MSELLFEIGVEDLPAAYVEGGRAFLQQGVSQALDTLRLRHGAVQAFGTPRRLTVLVRDIAQKQQDWQEEVLGPRVEIAWIPASAGMTKKSAETTKESRLSRAGQGFLRSTGMQEHDLFTKQTPKGEVIAVRKLHQGKPASALLPEALRDLIHRVPFAKTMRWDDSGVRFARPVRWLLILLDGCVLPVTFGRVQSGDTTRGHRFFPVCRPDERSHTCHPDERSEEGSPHLAKPGEILRCAQDDKVGAQDDKGALRVTGIDHYEHVLWEHSVMLDGAQRRQVIAAELERLAHEAGGCVLPDDELLDVVVNMVERPWPIRGTFDKRFLEIPRDILLCEMRAHQKCFAVVDEQGDLLPFFIAVCGTKPQDNDAAAAGNRRVLTARFEDGAFYFAQDCRQSLQQHAQALAGMGFAKGLGSMADKAARIRQLTDFLAQTLQLPPTSRESFHRAAQLCKADLATGVVGEFPQLQGTMGGIYAQRDGEPQDVARSIAEHYHPRFATDTLPTSESGAVVGLADRLDTLAGVLAVAKAPAGNRDPFALRRAAVAVCRLIVHRGYRLSLGAVLPQAARLHGERIKDTPEHVAAKVLQFLRGRLAAAFATSEDPLCHPNDGAQQSGDAMNRASTKTGGENDQEKPSVCQDDTLPAALVEAVAAAGCDDLLDVWARAHVINRWRGQDSAGFDAVTEAFKRVANLLDKVPPTCRPDERSDSLPHPEALSCHPERREHDAKDPRLRGGDKPTDRGFGEILPHSARQDDRKKLPPSASPDTFLEAPGVYPRENGCGNDKKSHFVRQDDRWGCARQDDKKDDGVEPPPDYAKHLTHVSEQNLLREVEELRAWLQQQDAAKLTKERLIQHYEQLLHRAVAVKPRVDALFDAVMVMDPDPALRQARLWLLGRLQQCLVGIADFKRLAALR